MSVYIPSPGFHCSGVCLSGRHAQQMYIGQVRIKRPIVDTAWYPGHIFEHGYQLISAARQHMAIMRTWPLHTVHCRKVKGQNFKSQLAKVGDSKKSELKIKVGFSKFQSRISAKSRKNLILEDVLRNYCHNSKLTCLDCPHNWMTSFKFSTSEIFNTFLSFHQKI